MYRREKWNVKLSVLTTSRQQITDIRAGHRFVEYRSPDSPILFLRDMGRRAGLALFLDCSLPSV